MTDLNCSNKPEATKEIKLGRSSSVTLVSETDYELASQWKWHLRNGYPCRAIWISQSPRRRKYASLHRVLLGAKDGETVDHINGNPLDNRRSNLRICTQLENSRNRKITGGSSQFKGVSLDIEVGRFSALIRINKVLKHLGYFDNEADAARCYNAAATEYFGEFARLNPVDDSGETWKEISIKAAHKHNAAKFSSKYIGVSLNKKLNQWVAVHAGDAESSYLGIFKNEVDAALCVDASIYEKHGDSRPRNFPNKAADKTLAQIQAGNSKKTSQYRGVKKTGKRWSAQISPAGVDTYIGVFDLELEAAEARDQYIKDNNIKRVKLNFPI